MSVRDSSDLVLPSVWPLGSVVIWARLSWHLHVSNKGVTAEKHLGFLGTRLQHLGCHWGRRTRVTGGMGQSRELPFLEVGLNPGPQARQSNALPSAAEWPQTQNPLASASSVAGMTGLHHQAQPKVESLSLEQCLAPRRPST